VRSQSPVAGALSRDRRIVASCILLISALAWAYLIQLDREMAAPESMVAKMGMALDAPWHLRDFLFTFAMWTAMMVGMMSAAAAYFVAACEHSGSVSSEKFQQRKSKSVCWAI